MARDWRSDRKLLVDLGLFGLLLGLLALLYQLGTFDSLLRLVGQFAASKALGVPVTVGAARITVDGQLELHDVVIHCAPDQKDMWAERYLVSVKRIRIACDPLSLLGKTWRFSEFCVDSIKLHVQKKDGVLNFDALAQAGKSDEANDEQADGARAAGSSPGAAHGQDKKKPSSSPSSQSSPQSSQSANATITTTKATVETMATTRTTVTTTTTVQANSTKGGAKSVSFQHEEETLTTVQANTSASMITGWFGAFKTGAEQIQKQIQTSGGTEAWAGSRLRNAVTNVRQRLDSEGGLPSLIVNQLKSTKDMVTNQVQRYKEGVQRVQIQELHHILRGDASRMPIDNGDPDEIRFLIDDFRIPGIEVQLRDVLPPHLKALETKPVTIKLIHMTHIGHGASPRSVGLANFNESNNSVGFTASGLARPTSRRAPPITGKSGVTGDYLRWLIERELITAVVTQAAPDVLYNGLAEIGKGLHKRTWEPLQSLIQAAPSAEAEQPLEFTADITVQSEPALAM